MGPSRFGTRRLLVLVALSAAFLAWDRSHGWHGSPFLTITQTPGAYVFWFSIGLVCGSSREPDGRSRRILGRRATVLVTASLGLVFSIWARGRAIYRFFSSDRQLAEHALDRGLCDLNDWLLGRESIPRFWKINCTHNPAAIVLGIPVAVLMFGAGYALGRLVSCLTAGRGRTSPSSSAGG
jgi:hypothetical protein